MDLKKIYGERYRVSIEASFGPEATEGKTADLWRYYELRGRYGFVYAYGADRPAVTFTSNIVANRFQKPAWKRIQDGDEERTFLIPKDDLNEVLEAIKVRKRRHLSEKGRNEAIERLKAYAFRKAPQSRSIS